MQRASPPYSHPHTLTFTTPTQVTRFRRGLVPKVRQQAGTASAVTGPRQLGVDAEEGVIYKVQGGAEQLDEDSLLRGKFLGTRN